MTATEMYARRLAWIEALESGELPQGRYLLLSNGSYCCIGVGARTVLQIGTFELKYFTSDLGDPYTEMRRDMGYSLRFEEHLTEMNDRRGRDFKFIARFLRKVWGIPMTAVERPESNVNGR